LGCPKQAFAKIATPRLEAHRLLMLGLIDELGQYRQGGVGVYDGEALVHMAPPASQLPRLMEDLLDWLKVTDLPPLVASCLFHYEFEFIHPFADGNGRMGRLWQTLILTQWRPELAWLPVESVVHDRQQAYYKALASADSDAEATPFVAFMLEALEQALDIALRQNDGVSEEVNDEVKIKLDGLDQQLLAYMRENPYITQENLVLLSGKSLSTIQRHIRKLRQQHIERVGSDKSGYWQVNDTNK
ncbi:Fic family protein, partial [Bathymodiolus platifrons methanotrophic gill symbiont]|uniref:Fic family protein n=1 Tax=Bathymodiolus platifrons methanotrophic gill symbiont TaxID=113268 RepID=UPI000B40B2FC